MNEYPGNCEIEVSVASAASGAGRHSTYSFDRRHLARCFPSADGRSGGYRVKFALCTSTGQ